MYAAAGRNTALAASGDCFAQLWNPSGGETVSVWRIEVYNAAAIGTNLELARTSTAGTTPGATVTPDLDNHFGRRAGPSSAPVLYLGNFATEPTEVLPTLGRLDGGVFIGGPVVYDLSVAPITIPPNSGLGLFSNSAIATVAEVSFIWEPGSSGVGDAYYVGGQADGLAAAESAWTTLWNPHASIALHVFQITFCNRSTETTEYTARIVRATGRGTPTATTVPDADNHVEQRATPPSGAVLDTGYAGDPTVDASHLFRWDFNGRAAAGGINWMIPTDDENGIDLDDCIVVPAGTGLTLQQNVQGVTTTKEVTFGWYE